MICLERVLPKARKSHQCNICFGVIGVGDTYIRERIADSGTVYTFKSHQLCDCVYWKVHSELNLYSDENLEWSELEPLIKNVFASMSIYA